MADIDDLIQEYLSGINVPQLAIKYGIPASTIYFRLNSADIKLRSGIESKAATLKLLRNAYSKSIAERFLAGESVKALAAAYSKERSHIILCLSDHGIAPRNRSEGMYSRMAQTSHEDRKKLAANANEVMRCLPSEFFQAGKIKQAVRKQSTLAKVGAGEPEMLQWLEEINGSSQVGYKPIPQVAFDQYNIDILLGPVAVEVHVNTSNPHSVAYYRKRIISLLNGGYDVLYIKVTKERPVALAAAYYADSFAKLRSRGPSIPCEYRMIRGDGQFVAAFCLDNDKASLIPVPSHSSDAA